ncbi:MAG: alpha/beta hydrolase [Ferruginibacter sp.]
MEYLRANPGNGTASQKLNIFSPPKKKDLKPVFIFIHGGSWNSGHKGTYNFFGTRLARKGIVSVIIDYPLSPKATYKEMAFASAEAVKWVNENIKNYGGDPTRIFLSGHSAGGHLAALVSVDNQYFDSFNLANPIKGTILIDAAGLDMYGYLKGENFEEGNTYLKTFTNDPVTWKKATPLYYLHKGMPPMLIYQGEKTYPSIKVSNEKFINALKSFAPNTGYQVLKGKKHIPMILQFFWTNNPRYKEIIRFMQESK